MVLTQTCYYLETQVFGGVNNRDMSLIETCFCSRLYGISLTFWQTVVRKYARAKVRSFRLKVLCVNVVHEHLHYTDLNHSAVEQYNRAALLPLLFQKFLKKKSRWGLFLWNTVWYLDWIWIVGQIRVHECHEQKITTLRKAKNPTIFNIIRWVTWPMSRPSDQVYYIEDCRISNVHVVHYTK